MAEQLREIDVMSNSIILELIGRNTAGSIALVAFQSLKSNKDPILLILYSDHLITFDENLIKDYNRLSNLLIMKDDIVRYEDKFGRG